MNKEVKTLGYLLKHYTDSQCYDQYVPLKWLIEQIELLKIKKQFCIGDAPDMWSKDILYRLENDKLNLKGVK